MSMNRYQLVQELKDAEEHAGYAAEVRLIDINNPYKYAVHSVILDDDVIWIQIEEVDD